MNVAVSLVVTQRRGRHHANRRLAFRAVAAAWAQTVKKGSKMTPKSVVVVVVGVVVVVVVVVVVAAAIVVGVVGAVVVVVVIGM